MNTLELTKPVRAATILRMQVTRTALGFGVMMALGLGGCVSVNAPDKPIVIELNINIKQEVIYRLSQDAGNTIDKNPEIF